MKCAVCAGDVMVDYIYIYIYTSSNILLPYIHDEARPMTLTCCSFLYVSVTFITSVLSSKKIFI